MKELIFTIREVLTGLENSLRHKAGSGTAAKGGAKGVRSRKATKRGSGGRPASGRPAAGLSQKAARKTAATKSTKRATKTAATKAAKKTAKKATKQATKKAAPAIKAAKKAIPAKKVVIPSGSTTAQRELITQQTATKATKKATTRKLLNPQERAIRAAESRRRSRARQAGRIAAKSVKL